MSRAAEVSYYSRVLYGAPTHRPLRMFMVGIVIVIVIVILILIIFASFWEV